MKIIDNLDAANPDGTEVLGSLIADAGARAVRAAAAIQIIRTANAGDYEVVLEGTIPQADSADEEWGNIGTFTQDEDGEVTVLTISLGVRYRFRHTDGVAVRCLMTN